MNTSRQTINSSANLLNSNVAIMQGAVVCEGATLIGEIYVGSNTVIHPHASVIAKSGPIIIGEFCVIEERAKIINNNEQNGKGTSSVMIIGSYNYFQVDCTIEARNIGDENIFQYKCSVGNRVDITDKCSIGAGCILDGDMKLEEGIIVMGENNGLRKNKTEDSNAEELAKLIKTLKEYLPRYHYCLKCNRSN